jgi:serpin B
MAMAMVAAGASGTTADQLVETIELDRDPAAAAAIAGHVLATWSSTAAPAPLAPDAPRWQHEEAERKRETLRVVNRVWAQRGKAFQPAFLELLARGYAAPLAELDFARAADASRLEINRWVAEATNQKIKDLLSPRHVTEGTRLVLTNAVYFMAAWRSPFKEGQTQQGVFEAADRPVPATLMAQTARLRYGEIPGGKVLTLPYASGSMSMVVVLPDAPRGLAALERTIDESTLQSWLDAGKDELVRVTLPRFRIDASLSLADQLRALGAADAFAYGPADLSGIDGTRELYVSAVVHKGYIAVDEKGTEAAAATAVVATPGSAPRVEPPKEFRADHPFLFVVRDNRSGHILFMGRLADPS